MKILSSLFLIALGVGSIYLGLHMNKGDILSQAEIVTSYQQANEGKFVAVQGALEVKGQIGDEYILENKYLALKRNVEMYAWNEYVSSDPLNEDSVSEVDNELMTTNYFNFEKIWQKEAKISLEHDIKGKFRNPTQTIESEVVLPSDVYIGGLALNLNLIEGPDYENLDIIKAIMVDPKQKVYDGKYIYIGNGTMEEPQLGDVRISYEKISPDGKFSAFGYQEGTKLKPYVFKGPNNQSASELVHKSDRIYSLKRGNVDKAIEQVKNDNKGEFYAFAGFGGLLILIGIIGFFTKKKKEITGKDIE